MFFTKKNIQTFEYGHMLLLFAIPFSWKLILRPIINEYAPIFTGKEFYSSKQWLDLRYRILRDHSGVCRLCGKDHGSMQVDHIKPRSKYPQLALDPDNLQILCADCNIGKSNIYEDDFR